jgi:hypothetical protein
MSQRQPIEPDKPNYGAGLPDYHDPLAGFGGAPPAQSALTLRLVLAAFGLIVCGVGAGWAIVLGAVGFGIFLAVLAAAALVDLAVIIFRKFRGEPG